MFNRFKNFEIVLRAKGHKEDLLLWIRLTARTPLIAANQALVGVASQEKWNFEHGYFDTHEDYEVIDAYEI